MNNNADNIFFINFNEDDLLNNKLFNYHTILWMEIQNCKKFWKSLLFLSITMNILRHPPLRMQNLIGRISPQPTVKTFSFAITKETSIIWSLLNTTTSYTFTIWKRDWSKGNFPLHRHNEWKNISVFNLAQCRLLESLTILKNMYMYFSTHNYWKVQKSVFTRT